MVGVALVAGITVIAASVKTGHATSSIDRSRATSS